MSSATKTRPMIRVATVVETGKRFLVQQIDFDSGRVHCWGEVEKRVNLRTRHAGVRAFQLDAVTIAKVAQTDALISDLFRQAIVSRKEAGYTIASEHTHNPKITGIHSASFRAVAADLGVDLGTASARDLQTITQLTQELGT